MTVWNKKNTYPQDYDMQWKPSKRLFSKDSMKPPKG